ncbi:alpha/beta hydrolase [Bacillus luteolus]|uniref:Alpha/beta hydrolase n=2 Tax=Litchfieldia luteola TaxID=682179 RepID=A0ABR9QM29_9BACI|nr:alpha/beta family hydrolase [Cytobacillus luteolus]MBE4909558.1 alpha/beta hydrolase [Cytobacillus luteolus]
MNPVTITNYEIDGYKQSKISYTMIKQKVESNTLAIILPGIGYNVQRPLLHFTTNLFIQSKYDVLHINYNYLSSEVYKGLSDEEKVECIEQEVKKVIDTVLIEKQYKEYVLVTKSIGTIPISNELLTRNEFIDAKAIWLTPLLHNTLLFERMKQCHHPSLYVIGDQDPCYMKDRFNELAIKNNINCVLIDGADHSLEDPEVLASIDNLKVVFEELQTFLASK